MFDLTIGSSVEPRGRVRYELGRTNWEDRRIPDIRNPSATVQIPESRMVDVVILGDGYETAAQFESQLTGWWPLQRSPWDRSTRRILVGMTTPVPTRFTDDELALIDELVDSGVAESRSAVIRRGLHDLAESVRRARVGATTAASYREQPQTPEDDELAMANAIAMTEAEPW